MSKGTSSDRAPSVFTGVVARSGRFLVTMIGLVFVAALVMAASYVAFHDKFKTTYLETGGIIHPTLLIGGGLTIITLGVLVRFGHVQWAELGWVPSQMKTGLLYGVSFWLAAEITQAVASFVSSGTASLSNDWTATTWLATIGVLTSQFVAIAPMEEMFFRGFLLRQVRAKLTMRNTTWAVVVAIAMSQTIFSLFHLPNLVLGVSGDVSTDPVSIAVQLAIDLGIGVVFAWLYIRTRNLFAVIALHGLMNSGVSVVAPTLDVSQPLLGAGLLAIAITYVVPVVSGFTSRAKHGTTHLTRMA